MTNIVRSDTPPGLAATSREFLASVDGMSDAQAYEHYKDHKNRYQYNTPETKRAFQEMNSSRCSFCTRYIFEFDSEMTVEHIELKSKCPRKIFEWDNLLCSCKTCNVKRSTNAYDRERYLDPTAVADIERYFSFCADGRVEPRQGLSEAERGRAQYMIALYKLNRGELVSERRRFFADLLDDDYYELLARRGKTDHNIIFWAVFAYYKRSREDHGR